MGFDFIVQYKSGRENGVADALSRKDEKTKAELQAISQPVPEWIHAIKKEIQASPKLQGLVEKVKDGETVGPWKYQDGILFFKNRIYLADNSPLIPTIVDQFHRSTHEGFIKMLQRVRSTFY